MMNEFREVSYIFKVVLSHLKDTRLNMKAQFKAMLSNADAANAKPLAVNYKAQNSKHLVDNKRNGKKVGTEGEKLPFTGSQSCRGLLPAA